MALCSSSPFLEVAPYPSASIPTMSLPKTRIYAIFTCLFSCLLLASGMAAIPSDIVEQVRGDAAAAQHVSRRAVFLNLSYGAASGVLRA